MAHDFVRLAILDEGAEAVRVVHAVRELAREDGTTPCTIALHGEHDQRAFRVREADETIWSSPCPTPSSDWRS